MTSPNTGLPNFDNLWDYDDPTATERRLGEILPGARDADDAGYLAELCSQIARAQGLQRRFEDAHRTLDEVEPLLRQAGPRATIRYLLERGRVFNSSGQREEARERFLAAFQLAEEHGADFYAVDAAHMLGIVEGPDRQLVWNLKAIELAEASADPRARGWLGSLYNNTGWTYHELGRYDEALATFQEGLTWQQREGRPRNARIAAWTVARALRSLGRLEEALAMQRANLEHAEAAGDSAGFTEEELGELLLALGREEEAREHFACAHALLREDPWLRADQPQRLERLARLGGVPD